MAVKIVKSIIAIGWIVEGKSNVYRVEKDNTLTHLPEGIDTGQPRQGLKFTDAIVTSGYGAVSEAEFAPEFGKE